MEPSVTETGTALDRDMCANAMALCVCFNLRRASRAVTHYFDESLHETGLRSTQLVILLAVAVEEKVSVAHLANKLGMDRTTMTRNLKPLQKRELVAIRPGEDRRTRMVTLSDAGASALLDSMPVWRRAQERFVTELGEEHWQRLLELLDATVEISRGGS